MESLDSKHFSETENPVILGYLDEPLQSQPDLSDPFITKLGGFPVELHQYYFSFDLTFLLS